MKIYLIVFKKLIPSVEIRKKTQITDVLETAPRSKWHWVGHISRKEPNPYDCSVKPS